MAFIWDSVSKDDIIKYDHIKEVTDNVDIVHDDPACISHNVTYHNGHLNMYDGTHYIGNDLTQRTGNLASPYYVGNDLSHLTGHRNLPHHSVDRSLPHYVTYRGIHYISQDTSPHNTTNRTSHLTVVRNPHNIGYNSSFYSKN